MLHLITHNSKFHIGDVASTALLRIVAEVHGYENSKTWRISDQILSYWKFSGILWDQDRLLKDVDNNTVARCIVYDIGDGKFNYNPQDILYHAANLTVPKGTFGLLWDEYGNGLAGSFASEFERDIVMPIDVNDLTGESNYVSSLVEKYMSDDNREDDHVKFESAVGRLYDLFKDKLGKLKKRSDVHIELNNYIELLNSINQAVKNKNKFICLSSEYNWRERGGELLDRLDIKLVATYSLSGDKIYVECVHGELPPYLLGHSVDKCSLEKEDFNNITVIDPILFCVDSIETANCVLPLIAKDMGEIDNVTKDKLEAIVDEIKTLESVKDTSIIAASQPLPPIIPDMITEFTDETR